VNFNVYAELSANFPDEAIQGEDGEMIDLGARTAAEAIAEILRGAGYELAPPEFMGDHGWDLNVRVDRNESGSNSSRGRNRRSTSFKSKRRPVSSGGCGAST